MRWLRDVIERWAARRWGTFPEDRDRIRRATEAYLDAPERLEATGG